MAVSDETFDELRDRLGRPKFDAYASRQSRALYVAQLQAVSEWISIARAKLGCRDPDDDKLLETAVMGEADRLVTGDRDLLLLSPCQGVPIVTPAVSPDLLRQVENGRAAVENRREVSHIQRRVPK